MMEQTEKTNINLSREMLEIDDETLQQVTGGGVIGNAFRNNVTQKQVGWFDSAKDLPVYRNYLNGDNYTIANNGQKVPIQSYVDKKGYTSNNAKLSLR